MLTPAEELGLSGLSLASRVRTAFGKIPEPDRERLGMLIFDTALEQLAR